MKPGLASTKGKWQVVIKVRPPKAKSHIKEAYYQSCHDLGVESIDLYYLHRIDTKTPTKVTMQAMKELIEKVRSSTLKYQKRQHRWFAAIMLFAR